MECMHGLLTVFSKTALVVWFDKVDKVVSHGKNVIIIHEFF